MATVHHDLRLELVLCCSNRTDVVWGRWLEAVESTRCSCWGNKEAGHDSPIPQQTRLP